MRKCISQVVNRRCGARFWKNIEQRVLVCGQRLSKQVDFTNVQLHDYIQAYQLSDGFSVWCLAVDQIEVSDARSWSINYLKVR